MKNTYVGRVGTIFCSVLLLLFVTQIFAQQPPTVTRQPSVRKDKTHRILEVTDECNFNNSNGHNAYHAFWNGEGVRIDILMDPTASDEFKQCGASAYPLILNSITVPVIAATSATEDVGGIFSYEVSLYSPKTEAGETCSGADKLLYNSGVKSRVIPSSGLDFVDQIVLDQPLVIHQPIVLSFDVVSWNGLSNHTPGPWWDGSGLGPCQQWISQDNGNTFTDHINFWNGQYLGKMNFSLTMVSDEEPPKIEFADDLLETMQENYGVDAETSFEADGTITTLISCESSFPDGYKRFPEPTVSDNITNQELITIDVTDVVNQANKSVTRTWRATDEAGNVSTLNFIIKWSSIPYQIILTEVKINGEVVGDNFEINVNPGQEVAMSAMAFNSCADNHKIFWYLEGDGNEEGTGELIKYKWNMVGEYAVKIKGQGINYNNEDEMLGTVTVGSSDKEPPKIEFGDDLLDVMVANYGDETNIEEAANGNITASISCEFYFPEGYKKFPEPIVSDNVQNLEIIIKVTDVLDQANKSVTRTWRATDQAGNVATRDFIIKWNSIPYQIILIDVKINDEVVDDDFKLTVNLGQEVTLRATTLNSCADNHKIFWYLEGDQNEEGTGEMVKYKWKTTGDHVVKIRGQGINYNNDDEMVGTISVEGPSFELTGKNVTCKGAANGEGVVSNLKNVVRFQWVDGPTLAKRINLKPGKYSVNAWDKNNQMITKSITISEPEAIVVDVNITSIECMNQCTGALTANIQGGTVPYTITWTNVATQAQWKNVTELTNLCTGEYAFSIADKNGCTKPESRYQILPGDPIPDVKFSAEVDPIDPTRYIFTNESTGATTYEWDFGDGEIDKSINKTVSHIYKGELTATYRVKLKGWSEKNKCPDIDEHDVQVKIVVGVENGATAPSLEFSPNPSGSHLILYNENRISIKEIAFISSAGREIVLSTSHDLREKNVEIDTGNIPNGVYIVSVLLADNQMIRRRLVILK